MTDWEPTQEECDLACDVLAGHEVCIYVSAPPETRMSRLERLWHRFLRWLREPDWAELADRDGSTERPFHSIREALDDAATSRCRARGPHKVMRISPGVYDENVVLDDNNVSFCGWTGGSESDQ